MRNTCLYKNKPKTFRRSSTKLWGMKGRKDTGWGTNLQNIEKGMRAIYVADGIDFNDKELEVKLKYFLKTGDIKIFKDEELEHIRIFIQVDQAGAEALIVAYECANADYRKLFVHGVKPHVYVALKLFPEQWKQKAKEHNTSVTGEAIDLLCKTPIELLKRDPYWREIDLLIKESDNWSTNQRYYYFAKQTVHSANYGIMENRFVMNVLEKSGGKVVIPTLEGKRFLMTYRGLFPEIPERNAAIKTQVDKYHVIYNTLGFPYLITNYNITEQTYQEYYAWPAQSTVGEITRIAYCTMYEHIRDNKLRWDILADTHDSYLIQCPLRDAGDCVRTASQFMNVPLVSPHDGTKYNMRSEWNIGFNWGPRKPDGSNPLGLQTVKWLN